MQITYKIDGNVKSFEFEPHEEVFRDTLDQISSETPDFVYKAIYCERNRGSVCAYSVREDNKWVGSCLIGTALIRMGVPGEFFESFSPHVGDKTLNENIGAKPVMELLGFGEDAKNFAQEVQALQDNGSSWGDSVSEAKEIDHWSS